MSRDTVFDALEQMWDGRDPVPVGLVARMQAVAQAEVALADTDLDYELMMLVERTSVLAGTRSATTAYTLRFATGDLDLLVRAGGGDGEVARLDGWIVPPAPAAVRATQVGGDERSWEVAVDAQGRFEVPELPAGLYRLFLTPSDPDAKPFGTPAFEI
ncbi:MAG: hypothetical protein R2731_08200 [Nocardioides sp.]